MIKRHYFLILSILLIPLNGAAQTSVTEGNRYALTIDQVSELAMQNNFEIQLAQYDALIAATKETAARSLFDTLLEGEVNYQENEEAVSSTLLGTRKTDKNINGSVSKLLPTGTRLQAQLLNNRSFTNSSFTTSPTVHESTLSLGLQQDLGKNFFGIQDRGSVQKALLAASGAEYSTIDRISQSLAQVQKAYWDLARAKRLVTIEEEMLAQARRLLDVNTEKNDKGLVEDPELLASQANYRQRQNALWLAENAFQAQMNVLKLLLNIEKRDVALDPISPIAAPQHSESLAESLKLARSYRWDYKEKLNEARIRKLDVALDHQNLWPEINLAASFARNGLGDHFKQSIEKMAEEDNPNFFVGLSISFPLENRAARAKLEASQLQDAKVLLELKLLERIIVTDVKDLVRTSNIYRQVADNAAEAARLQEKKLRAELKNFEYGRSDTDIIIRFQEDALDAKRQELSALTDYRKALVDLRQSEGALLGEYWNAK